MSVDMIRDLGEPVKLGTRIAAEVAWRSVRVRVGRSLVTLSSVILAVAFLVVVMGDGIASRAVWGVLQVENRDREDAQRVKALAKRARDRRALLALYARNPEGTAAWVADTGHELPPIDAGVISTLITLTRWIEGLDPNQQYLLVRTDGVIEHLLTLEEPELTKQERELEERGQDPAQAAPLHAVRRFLFESHHLTGVLQPVDDEEVRALSRTRNELGEWFATLQAAEADRRAAVEAAGGADAVLADLLAGAGIDELAAQGLPVDQVLAEPDRIRLRAIAEHITYQQHLARLGEILGRSRVKPVPPGDERVSYAKPLPMEDYLAGELERHPCRAAIAAEINAAYAEIAGKTEGLKEILAAERWPDESTMDLASYRERGLVQTYDEDGPVFLPRRDEIRSAIDSLLGVPFAEDLERLQRYKRLDALAMTFKRKGFDPEASGQRTFWLLVLSFIVCVVGIVNSMTMAVTERFREIATMKCLGAVDGFILQTFMIESGAIGLIGAMLGCLAGALISVLRASADFGGYYWSSLPVSELGLSLLFALACGLVLTVVGALLPAYKAARMHPIEAMRLEG